MRPNLMDMSDVYVMKLTGSTVAQTFYPTGVQSFGQIDNRTWVEDDSTTRDNPFNTAGTDRITVEDTAVLDGDATHEADYGNSYRFSCFEKYPSGDPAADSHLPGGAGVEDKFAAAPFDTPTFNGRSAVIIGYYVDAVAADITFYAHEDAASSDPLLLLNLTISCGNIGVAPWGLWVPMSAGFKVEVAIADGHLGYVWYKMGSPEGAFQDYIYDRA